MYSDTLSEPANACLMQGHAAFEGSQEDAGEHRAIEEAGVGVAQGGVVAAEEGDVVRQQVLGPMAKSVGGAAFDDTFVEEVGEVAVPCDFAEADDDADFGEGGNLGGEMRRAVANLYGRGFVAGRGAADDGADPDLAEFKAVVAADGGWFAGQGRAHATERGT